MSGKLEHYLISIQTMDMSQHFHAYVMCTKRREYQAVVDKMLEECETRDIPILPILLITKLDTGIDYVRGVVRGISPETKDCIDRATDFHYSGWMMKAGDPVDVKLMALH